MEEISDCPRLVILKFSLSSPQGCLGIPKRDPIFNVGERPRSCGATNADCIGITESRFLVRAVGTTRDLEKRMIQLALRRGVETIAYATNGSQERWIVRVRLDLFPDSPYVHVYRPRRYE